MPSLIRRAINAVKGKPSAATAAPPVGETSGAQSFLPPNLMGIGGGVGAGIPGFVGGFAGGLFGDPFSGQYGDWVGTDPYAYGQRWLKSWYWGTYNTYRLVAAHPRCQQAFATLTNPILAGSWDYEVVVAGCPDWLVTLVKDQCGRLRRPYLRDALQAVNLGWQGFEPVWDVRDAKHWLARLKPLLQDITTIRTDAQGNVTELVNGSGSYVPTADGPGRLLVEKHKAFVYSFRPTCGYWYGYPLTENVRLSPWRMWLSAAFDLHQLSHKLSSMIALGFAPAGSYDDGTGTGTKVSPTAEMGKALSGLKDTGMAVFSNLVSMAKPGATMADLQKAAASALSSIEFHDAGNHSAAIGGYVSIMDKAEDLFFAAYLQSSRAGMQSQHGSRADAETHSDTGLVSSQLIADDLAEQFQPMVDAILVLNGGEQWRGAVRVKQSPLVDDTKSLYGQLLTTALQDQTVGPELYGVLDFEAIARRVDVATKEGADVNGAVQAAVEKRRQQQDQAAQAQLAAAKNPQQPGASEAQGKTEPKPQDKVSND